MGSAPRIRASTTEGEDWAGARDPEAALAFVARRDPRKIASDAAFADQMRARMCGRNSHH